ncbi:MAG: peptide chain release factor N(5)-glutamine methyltransferase [Lachnospiraceae bacterium]|nr:peptide chain release factor N(5)-glutamine methyltransferase [Lachnospiraceae bacterium]
MKGTYQELLAEGIMQLEAVGIADASLDAWYLLSLCFHIDRMHFLMERSREQEWQEDTVARYQHLIEKRAAHIPLQQLTGEQEFMGLPFLVNEHVLIPRQDTEILVEHVLEWTAEQKDLTLLDMCTGSGCIALSLAVLGKEQFSRVLAVDVSSQALEVARENGRRLQAEVEWLKSDMFQNVPVLQADVIVSNPPYIRPDVIETLMPEVRDHEPRMALDGGRDGLDFYRVLTKQAASFLKDQGVLAVEIGYDQGEAVSELFAQYGFESVQVIQDLAGLDRVVMGRKRCWR